MTKYFWTMEQPEHNSFVSMLDLCRDLNLPSSPGTFYVRWGKRCDVSHVTPWGNMTDEFRYEILKIATELDPKHNCHYKLHGHTDSVYIENQTTLYVALTECCVNIANQTSDITKRKAYLDEAKVYLDQADKCEQQRGGKNKARHSHPFFNLEAARKKLSINSTTSATSSATSSATLFSSSCNSSSELHSDEPSAKRARTGDTTDEKIKQIFSLIESLPQDALEQYKDEILAAVTKKTQKNEPINELKS